MAKFPHIRFLEPTSSGADAGDGAGTTPARLVCVNATAIDGTFTWLDVSAGTVAARVPLAVPVSALEELHSAKRARPASSGWMFGGGDGLGGGGSDADEDDESGRAVGGTSPATLDAIPDVPTVHDFVTLPHHDVLIASFANWRPLAVVSCLDGSVMAWLNGCPWPAAYLTYVPSLHHIVAGGRGKEGLQVWDTRGAVHYARQVAMQTTPPYSADVRTVVAGQPVDSDMVTSRRVRTHARTRTTPSHVRHPGCGATWAALSLL